MNQFAEIKALMQEDPLALAEIITGNDYKEDEQTVSLGLTLQMHKSKMLAELLDKVDDTKFSETVPNYIRKITGMGFEQVYVEDFVYKPDYGNYPPQHEKMFLFFNTELGILIRFDTFNGNVNGGSMYYNWSPNYGTVTGRNTSSGSFYWPKPSRDGGQLGLLTPDLKDTYEIPDMPERPVWGDGENYEDFKTRSTPIDEKRHELLEQAFKDGYRSLWIGNHEAREGVKTIIQTMMEAGTFLPNWRKPEFGWLVNFADYKQPTPNNDFTSYYDKTHKILAQLPENVRMQIGTYKE